MTTSGDRYGERTRLAEELRSLRLLPGEWDGVAAALEDVEAGQPDAIDRLTQVVFEARVAQRFRGGRARSTLPPTKRVSALPWVGLVCGAVLFAVGGALGGGLVLVGVAILSVGVFAVAVAGSRVAHRGHVGVQGAGSPQGPRPVPIPDQVRARMDHLSGGWAP